MRVVLLTPHYPRWPGDTSGASIGALARALVRRGIALRVVAPAEDSTGIGEVDGIPVRRVRVPGAASGPDQLPSRWNALLRLWRGLRSAVRHEITSAADLIHAHSLPSGLAAPPRLPLVLTLYAGDVTLLLRSRTARRLAKPMVQRAALVSAVSRQAAESVQSITGRFIAPAHTHAMPVDTRAHPWTRGGEGAVVIADLNELTRVELAVETVAVLASCGHELPLTIVGDGPARGALEQLAQRAGVASMVRFVGAMPLDQARGYLSRADVLLYTGKGEPFAPSAVEALLSGVPVIACWDAGAAVDIVPQSGIGRLSLPAAEALADSVLSLQSDADRLAMGRLVGEAWRSRLAPDHVAELCEGWYREALANPSR